MEIVLLLAGLALGGVGMHFFRRGESALQGVSQEQIQKLEKEFQESQRKLEMKEEVLKEKEKQIAKFEAASEQYQERLQGAGKKIALFEAQEAQRQKEQERSMERAAELQRGFEEQKVKLHEADTLRRQAALEARDRVWNEHEIEAISGMKTACKSLGMIDFYDNTNLPEGFDGKLKPDFMVGFLNQFIIFDAKMKKPDSKHTLHDYLRGQAQSTAKKIKQSSSQEQIYKTVFFVVPSVALVNLKQTSFHEEGFGFHVISTEAFEPVLAMLQKVTEYKNLDKIDPQERENIIEVLSKYDQQVNWQNAVNICCAQQGVKMSQEKERLLSPDMLDKVQGKRSQLRVENLKPTDLKRLTQNLSAQKKDLEGMMEPLAPPVSAVSLEEAQTSLLD